MWTNHKTLHNRIVSILGEDIQSREMIMSLRLAGNQALVEIYEIYEKFPKNFQKKEKDTLRFDLLFEPFSVSVQVASKEQKDSKPLLFITENEIELKLGSFVYKYDTRWITFSGFQALSYVKVIDNNFGRMIDIDTFV